MAIWEQVKKLCYWIFYQKPLAINRRNGLKYDHLNMLYRYFYIFILTGWVIPWIATFTWYATIVKSRTSNHTRHLLGDVCIKPYLSPENDTPWYPGLWDKQGALSNHTDVRPPPCIENIMISHVKFSAIEEALRQTCAYPYIYKPHRVQNTTGTFLDIRNRRISKSFHAVREACWA